uniref:Uncharacterized protein n=1 Tax=Ciona savignyi TaxID=51511 RepID=H2YMF2_CIOSA
EQRFRDLCLAVNLDKPTMEYAWRAYENAKENYSLEGDCLHWLTCTLYSACRTNLSSVKTLAGKTVTSNCVSLTMLLRKAKLSFISFLKKMDKWLQMNPNEELSSHVAALERSFRVSTVVFKKYRLVFTHVFLDPDDPKYQRATRGSSKNPSRPRRNRQKLLCNPRDVFNFCWTLFVHARGLPDNWQSRDFTSTNNHDIITLLVEQQSGMGLSETEREKFLLETRVVNIHNWVKHVNSLLDSEGLTGEQNTLFSPQNFESNSKAIGKLYEEYVITEGDFDERVFLHDDVDNELGTPIKCPPPVDVTLKKEVDEHLANTNSLALKTPLTNREYLHGRNQGGAVNGLLTPVSSAWQDVMKLKKLLHGKSDAPSDKLSAIFKDCADDPSEEVTARVERLKKTIKLKHTERCGDIPAGTADIGDQRATMSSVLYYHILESIVLQEKKRLNGKSDLSELLKRDDFHNLLFACCVEIVMCSFKAERVFPWALTALNLSPYYFYKVIELVIRAEDSLWGHCIKHLNHIEERILEALAWQSDSTLWQVLGNAESIAPLCEEVNHSQHIENVDKSVGANKGLLAPDTPKSPPTHPRVKAVLEGDVGSFRKFEPGTARDRFSSPSPGSAKRRLFIKDPTSPSSGSLVGLNVTNIAQFRPKSFNCRYRKNSIKVVAMDMPNSPGGKTYLVQQTSPGVLVILKVMPVELNHTKKTENLYFVTQYFVYPGGKPVTVVSVPSVGENKKPRKTGSLALFFRKVYHLASVRLRHLCEQLVISPDLRAKIWTCFEFSLSKHAYTLMRDRHIDQLLMCAVYIIAKITQHDQSFQEIMRCYRNQPQATSNVYRNVLIRRSSSPRLVPAQAPRSMRSNSTVPRSNPSSPAPGTTAEERDDLIQFYNKVYVPVMREYVKKFSSSS